MPMIENTGTPQTRLFIGVPMTGLIRSEWAMARYGQIIPCNWSHTDHIQWLDQFSPVRFQVADARNLIVAGAVQRNSEWLLFIDHDVVLPPTTFVQLNDYMVHADVPIVGGLYFTKSVPSEPLMYRGIGTGYYAKWKLGDKVWVTGLGMGCTLIHCSILRRMWEDSEPYKIGDKEIRRVFHTPGHVAYDPETKTINANTGTEDIHFLARIKKEHVLEKAGWAKFQRKDFPYLVDTNIFCYHIDMDGTKYPARGEHLKFK